MKTSARAWTAKFPLLVAGLLLAAPLRAQSADSAMMKHDSMKSGEMKKDAMKDDAMQGGAMKHDAMQGGEMKHDAMAKNDKMMGQAMMGPHGMLKGGSGHQTSGGYEIVTEAGRQWVKLGDDFSLDNAPDPYVVLSPSDKGNDKNAINLGKLRNLKGAQAYEIPAGTDLSRFAKVIIYCRKYNATLGIADLALAGEMMHN